MPACAGGAYDGWMGDTPRVVVIGSGIGGSAAALLLAHAGLPVTLVEKNRRVGGSCSAYEKQGFQIDVGTHMFSRGAKGPLGDVLRRVGHEGAIDFRRTRDISELRFRARDGREPYRVPVPAHLSRVPMFAARVARALRLSPRDAVRAGRLFSHILTMSDEEVASWDGRTLEEFVEPYTDHAPTLALFGFLLGLYFILPYWEVSAGEALHCFRKMAFDNALSYPRGGSIAVPSTFVRLAEARGAEVRTGIGVRRVAVEGGRVTGVVLDDGTTLPADVVVSTSSLRSTVRYLVGLENVPEAFAARALAIKGSHIAEQAKIGMRKRLVRAGSIVGGVGEDVDLADVTADDMKDMFASVMRGEIPRVVPFYCPVPTNFDPDLAPPGCQLLTVCAVAPTTDVDLRDPPKAWEEAMIRTIARVVPGLEEHALFVDRFGVDFIERWTGKEFGPAVSTGQTPDQVGRARPAVRAPVRGLYFAGCNAGGRGVGTELAAASAMECADAILADHGRAVPRLAPRPGTRRRRAAALAARPVGWVTRMR